MLYFSCTFLRLCSSGMEMPNLLFLYISGLYPYDVGNVWFIFLLCMLALCMMYVYVCVCVCVFIFACLWVVVHFV